MIRSGNDRHVETLAGPDQRIGQPGRRCRMHIVVHVSGDEQQPSGQPVGQFDVGRNMTFEMRFPVFPPGLLYSVESFAPPLGVNIIVMVPRSSHPDLVKFRMVQHGGDRHETASGMSVNSDSFNIGARIAGCNLPDRGHVVGQSIVPQIPVAERMEIASAPGAAAAVGEIYDDESQLCERLIVVVIQGKGLRNQIDMGAGIDIADDRVFPPGFPVERKVDDAIEPGHGIRSQHFDDFRFVPSAGIEFRKVARLQFDTAAAFHVADLMPRGTIHTRPSVRQETSVGRECHRMFTVSGSEQNRLAAAESGFVIKAVMRIDTRFPSVTLVNDRPGERIDTFDLSGDVFARSDGPLQASVSIVQVIMTISRSLRPPEDIAAFIQDMETKLLVILGRFAHLADNRLDTVRREIDPAQFHAVARPAATNEPGITVRMSDHAEPGNFDFLIGPAGDVEFPNAHAVGIDQPGIVLNDMLIAGHGKFVAFSLGARSGEVVHQRELLHLALVFAHQQVIMAFPHPAADGGAARLRPDDVVPAGGERMIALPVVGQPYTVASISAKEHEVMTDSRNIIRAVGGVAAPIVAPREKIPTGSILPGLFAQFAISAIVVQPVLIEIERKTAGIGRIEFKAVEP